MEETVYRASELGACTRRLALLRQGYEPYAPPARMQGYFDRGTSAEAIVRDEMIGRGFRIEGDQTLVRIAVSGRVFVDGHVDGFMFDTKEDTVPRYVWECKRMNRESFDAFVERGWEMGGLMERYKWQTSAYMVATGMELMFTVLDGNRYDEDGIVRLHHLYREVPFYTEQQIKVRVLSIEAMQRPPEVCDNVTYPCPVFYMGCEAELPEQADEELSALALAALEATADVSRAKAKSDAIRKKLAEKMEGKETTRTDDATLSWVTPSTNKLSLQMIADAMGCDVEDLNRYYTKTKGTPYVRVTRRQGSHGNDGVEVGEPKES